MTTSQNDTKTWEGRQDRGAAAVLDPEQGTNYDMMMAGARRQLRSLPLLTSEALAGHLQRAFPMARPDQVEEVAKPLADLDTAALEEIVFSLEQPGPEVDHRPSDDEPKQKPRGPQLLSIDQVLELPDAEPLVHGVLSRGDLAMLYGVPGSGKSFLALSMSLAVSGGAVWSGHATVMGTVVFGALEGLAGFRRRIPAAIVGPIPDDVRDRFFMIGGCVNLHDVQAAGPLIRALEQIPEELSLLVVDTLHRASGGADENSAQEMGGLIAACDAIRSRFGCAVLLVHHCRKEGGTYRGSSAIEGALDVQMLVTKTVVSDRSFVLLKSEKSKDDEPFADLSFELQRIELDERDQWGRVRTSLRLVPSSDAGDCLPGWFRGEREDYVALSTILAFAQDEPLTTKQLAEQIDTPDSTVRSKVLRLAKARYVERTKSKPPRLIAGPAVPASLREVPNG